ncbi:MAG TPA: hypothetical protein VIK98_01380 [Limnochordales bacterium]
MAVLGTALAACAAWLMLPRFLKLIERAGFVRSNFRGQPVPVAAGAGLAIIYGTALMLLLTVESVRVPQAPAAAGFRLLSALLLASLGMALVGLIDDVFGDRSATGLRGHFSRLREGVLTTGALKALFGGVTGVAAAVLMSPAAVDVVLNTLLIPLSANAFNLLDLRPGRAAKAFLLLVAAVWATAPGAPVWPYVLPLLVITAVYLPYDLRAQAMLGDAGSNLLGGAAGIAVAAALPALGRAALLSLLVALHVYAERASLSELIERVTPLRWLDQWGRE